MNAQFFYKARYGQSHGLVIGINTYAHAAPLSHAVNDAVAVKSALVDTLGFPADNVTVLLDSEATAGAIRSALWHLAKKTSYDDRVVVFFAGHGETMSGRNGDVGFLVPVEGRTAEGSTLIPWRELVSTVTTMMHAKHVLFVMDACYSGLATTRKPAPGATRFVGDLLKRKSVQVITAGKANQAVSDGNGPRPGHSAFTGHLLNGLEGAAITEGVLTATGLMSYVYHQVGLDEESIQTPHYGSLDGDGDLIFIAPGVGGREDVELTADVVFTLPYVDQEVIPRDALTQKITRAKALLASDAGSIELHDLLMDEVRAFLGGTPDDAFPLHGTVTAETVAVRVGLYEQACSRLSVVSACVAYWGSPAHRQPLLKVFARLSDRIDTAGGNTAYLSLRWLPVLTVFYASGIAAVNAGRMDTLAQLFAAPVPGESYGRRSGSTLAGVMTDAVLALYQSDAMRAIPAFATRHAAFSDYMFETLQPRLDDALYLGKDYEAAFDQFEMLACLAGLDAALAVNSNAPYGIPGRFSGKGNHLSGNNKFSALVAQARKEGSSWAPLKMGMFGGELARLQAALNQAAPLN
jgi:hypothetical protein